MLVRRCLAILWWFARSRGAFLSCSCRCFVAESGESHGQLYVEWMTATLSGAVDLLGGVISVIFPYNSVTSILLRSFLILVIAPLRSGGDIQKLGVGGALTCWQLEKPCSCHGLMRAALSSSMFGILGATQWSAADGCKMRSSGVSGHWFVDGLFLRSMKCWLLWSLLLFEAGLVRTGALFFSRCFSPFQFTPFFSEGVRGHYEEWQPDNQGGFLSPALVR